MCDAASIELVFTTDFHASFPEALSTIESCFVRKRQGAVILDSGDFLGESAFTGMVGYEKAEHVQNSLYDVLCPGNHGFTRAILSRKSTCCNLYRHDSALCRPFVFKERSGFSICVLGVLGEEAFEAIPVAERRGINLRRPLSAVQSVLNSIKGRVDFHVVLSHTGFRGDLSLAEMLPKNSMILSGHCHSENIASCIDGVHVLKAPELGTGYGTATISAAGLIDFGIHRVGPKYHHSPSSSDLLPMFEEIGKYHQLADHEVGKTKKCFLSAVSDRRKFLTLILSALSELLNAPVLLNNYVFRILPTSHILTVGSFYSLVPFDNELVRIHSTNEIAQLARLRSNPEFSVAGNLVRPHSVITTDYIARNVLAVSEESVERIGLLRTFLASVLIELPKNSRNLNQ